MVKIEPTNRHDIHTVAIYRDAKIVGHVPYNLTPRMSAFFMRENKAFEKSQEPKTTGELEVPCIYSLYGPNVYVDKMKALVESLLIE